VEKRFKDAQDFGAKNAKAMKTKSDIKIPLLIFDEIGLTEKSPDNPLKAIHEPLELTGASASKVGMVSFLGVSNTNLDLSKMSRLLILRRPDMSVEDLQFTAREISKGEFERNGVRINHTNLEPYLDDLCSTYHDCIRNWKQSTEDTVKNFYGLRDFYSLIRTLSDLIQKNRAMHNL
jgi:hypothetical protein